VRSSSRKRRIETDRPQEAIVRQAQAGNVTFLGVASSWCIASGCRRRRGAAAARRPPEVGSNGSNAQWTIDATDTRL